MLHLVSKLGRPAAGTVVDMDERQDVVVVGARCAGAATAMLLARYGHRVTVIERGRFPSDTLSTHGIARGGVVQLSRWGLLDRVVHSGAPAVRAAVFRVGDTEDVRPIKDRAGVDHLVAPRRYVLDQILADAAVESGATVHFGLTATGLERDGDRVAGVIARTGDGQAVRLRASVVVGADGLRSRVAAHAGSAVREFHPADNATFYLYVAGLDRRGFEFHIGQSALAGVFPTHDGAACVWVCCSATRVGALHGGAVEGFLDLLGGVSPSLAARVRAGRRGARVRGAVRLPNQIRQATGPGWALVGDAGYHRDPITGHGITDAFRDAELLARAVDDLLRGQAEDLSSYELARDTALRETFDLTCAMTRYPSSDEFVALQKRLSRALDVEAESLASQPIPVSG